MIYLDSQIHVEQNQGQSIARQLLQYSGTAIIGRTGLEVDEAVAYPTLSRPAGRAVT